MNAYELADKLQMDKAKALLYVDTVVQSADMLRQQADRIAELEKALGWIATVNAMDYEYQDVAKSLLKERHGIK
jgi:hypothetical protein